MATVPCANNDATASIATVVFPTIFIKPPSVRVAIDCSGRRIAQTARDNNLHMMTRNGHLLPNANEMPMQATDFPVRATGESYLPVAPTVSVKFAVSFRRAAFRMR